MYRHAVSGACSVVFAPRIALPTYFTQCRDFSFTKNVSPNVSKSAPMSPQSSKALTKQEQRKNYARDGYLVVKNLLSPAEVQQISDELVAIARGRYGEFEGFSPASGQLKDNEVVARFSRIDYPHKISPNLFDLALAHPRVTDVLTALIGPNVKCMKSKAYIDGPGERGRVWHQDESLIPTRDRSLLCAIIAIDDHTAENGCPLMHPGSHKSGVIFRMRQPSPPPESPLPEGQTLPDQEVAQVTTFPPSTSSDTESDAAPLEIEAYDVSRDPDAGVPIEMTAGTVIFVNGYTLQRLLPNTSSYVLRRALKIHYCSAETLLPWTMDGVVPMTADNRDIVMIAGKDPYAYKGTAEHAVARAHMKHTE